MLKNSSFAPKFSQNDGLPAEPFAFLDQISAEFWTVFPTVQNRTI